MERFPSPTMLLLAVGLGSACTNQLPSATVDGGMPAASDGAMPGHRDSGMPPRPDAAVPPGPDAAVPPDFWDASNLGPAHNVMMFKFLNRTNGKFRDTEVFWS